RRRLPHLPEERAAGDGETVSQGDRGEFRSRLSLRARGYELPARVRHDLCLTKTPRNSPRGSSHPSATSPSPASGLSGAHGVRPARPLPDKPPADHSTGLFSRLCYFVFTRLRIFWRTCGSFCATWMIELYSSTDRP